MSPFGITTATSPSSTAARSGSDCAAVTMVGKDRRLPLRDAIRARPLSMMTAARNPSALSIGSVKSVLLRCSQPFVRRRPAIVGVERYSTPTRVRSTLSSGARYSMGERAPSLWQMGDASKSRCSRVEWQSSLLYHRRQCRPTRVWFGS